MKKLFNTIKEVANWIGAKFVDIGMLIMKKTGTEIKEF